MIVIKDLTELIQYQETESTHNFFELMTATVSHEMLTPLNSVLALLSSLIRSVTEPKLLMTLRIINSSSCMLRYLVNDMVDLFQIKNNQFKQNIRRVRVPDEIKDFSEIIKEPCIQKGLEFEVTATHDLDNYLMIDIQRVKQVLMNLAMNAVKFTLEGFVHISLDYDVERQLLVGTVQDSGIGISQEDQGSLFKIFGKLKSTKQVNTNGIGLGLYICKQICSNMGGEIKLLHSELGKGTTFEFTLSTRRVNIE